MDLIEPTKLLVQSITTDSALPAIDWSAVLSPLLCSDVYGELDGLFNQATVLQPSVLGACSKPG